MVQTYSFRFPQSNVIDFEALFAISPHCLSFSKIRWFSTFGIFLFCSIHQFFNQVIHKSRKIWKTNKVKQIYRAVQLMIIAESSFIKNRSLVKAPSTPLYTTLLRFYMWFTHLLQTSFSNFVLETDIRVWSVFLYIDRQPVVRGPPMAREKVSFAREINLDIICIFCFLNIKRKIVFYKILTFIKFYMFSFDN